MSELLTKEQNIVYPTFRGLFSQRILELAYSHYGNLVDTKQLIPMQIFTSGISDPMTIYYLKMQYRDVSSIFATSDKDTFFKMVENKDSSTVPLKKIQHYLAGLNITDSRFTWMNFKELARRFQLSFENTDSPVSLKDLLEHAFPGTGKRFEDILPNGSINL